MKPPSMQPHQVLRRAATYHDLTPLDPLYGERMLLYAIFAQALRDAKARWEPSRTEARSWMRARTCRRWCELLGLNHGKVLAWLARLG